MATAITKTVYLAADGTEFMTEADAVRHEFFTALKDADGEPSGTYSYQHEAIYRAITKHFDLTAKEVPQAAEEAPADTEAVAA